MLPTPKIEFSKWVPWSKRAAVLTASEPWLGVYMWAHFHDAPATDTSPSIDPAPPRELIYVGETKNLNARALRRSAEGGLERYAETFPADRELKHLYLSVCSVRPFQGNDEAYHVHRAFTRYVEDMIYWKFVKEFERRAALDYARKSGYTLKVADCCCDR
jgi:hypothetical protein